MNKPLHLRIIPNIHKPPETLNSQKLTGRIVPERPILSDLGFYPPKVTPQITVYSPNSKRKLNEKQQLLTFDKEKNSQKIQNSSLLNKHDSILRNELTRFRAEIEQKYNVSHMNHTYKFPRQNANDDEQDYDEKISTCIFVRN